jgi:hypothetical protein
MNDLVKYVIIVTILVGVILALAGAEIGRTMGGILLLWGVAGWTTVEEKR